MHKSPAQLVIESFGGVRKTARSLRRDPSTVSRWQRSSRGGRGGVPKSLYKKILQISKNKGYGLTLNDLVYGRTTRKTYKNNK